MNEANKLKTLSDVMAEAMGKLKGSGIHDPSLDAQWLTQHALGLDRARMLSEARRVLTPEERQRIDELMARRAAREPVARILGEREFWGLPFGLNEATLEPRPDSETLVEVVGRLIRILRTNNVASAGETITAPRLLDLGTGTGCLLLALLHEWPEATGLGIDVARRAVEQAQANAERLGLASRAEFRIGDWLEGVAETFDVIVSNPPYIAAADIPCLMPEVRAHDPLAALDGGADGLVVYRHLIPQLPQFLKPQGFVVLEVGQGQADAVADLCLAAGLEGIEKHRDLGGVERCVSSRMALNRT